MITDRELKALRKEQEKWMPNEVVITRPRYVGDQKFVPDNVGTSRCRITPGLGRWAVVADRYQGITPFVMTFPYAADLMDGDTLVDAYGRTFLVRDVRAPKDFATAKQLLAEMVTDG